MDGCSALSQRREGQPPYYYFDAENPFSCTDCYRYLLEWALFFTIKGYVTRWIAAADDRSYAMFACGDTPAYFGGLRPHCLRTFDRINDRHSDQSGLNRPAFNLDKLIVFMDALIRDADKKVFLTLDNLRVHHRKPVKSWAAERTEMIEPHYLPTYSPESNPEERLNADMKHAITSKIPVCTNAKLRATTIDHRSMFVQTSARVKQCFGAPKIPHTAFQILCVG